MERKLTPIIWGPIQTVAVESHDPDAIKLYFRQYGKAAGESRTYKRGAVLTLPIERITDQMKHIPEMGVYPEMK